MSKREGIGTIFSLNLWRPFVTKFRILIWNEGGEYVVQCLERDIASQGESLEVAIKRLCEIITAEIKRCKKSNINPLSDIAPAPDIYHRKFERLKIPVNPREFISSHPDLLPRNIKIAEARAA